MMIWDVEQNTEEWSALHIGMPTASAANRVVTSTGDRSKQLDKYATYLGGCLFAGKDLNAWKGNHFTERGHELEQEAIDAYTFLFDEEVERIGFATTNDGRYGCSPDGLVQDQKGAVEIKCFPERHIEVLLGWNKNRSFPSDLVAQVQMQMLVCGLEFVDSFFYQPSLPSLRVRHEPNEKIQQGLTQYLAETIEKRDQVFAILKEIEER